MRRVKILRSMKPITSLRRHLSGWRGLLGIASASLARQRKINLDTERILQMQKNREVLELKAAQTSNQLVLQDIKIEMEKLKLEELRRKLANADPDNFTRGVTP